MCFDKSFGKPLKGTEFKVVYKVFQQPRLSKRILRRLKRSPKAFFSMFHDTETERNEETPVCAESCHGNSVSRYGHLMTTMGFYAFLNEIDAFHYLCARNSGSWKTFRDLIIKKVKPENILEVGYQAVDSIDTPHPNSIRFMNMTILDD